MPMCGTGIATVRYWIRSTGAALAVAALGASLFVTPGVVAQEANAPAEPAPPAPAENAAAAEPAKPAAEMPNSVEALFADYLHFARMGRFDAAELYAAALLQHAEFKPEVMLGLAEKYRNSRETLLTLIDGSTIRENAARILAQIREGEILRRQSPAQISDAIQLLTGDPTQRNVGLERLRFAGEYAIPLIVDCLRDAGKAAMHPYIERALPKIGPAAVSPLVVALGVSEDAVRETLMDALAAIGHPQALPYLKRYAEDGRQTASVRKSAAAAIEKILRTDPGLADLPAAAGFQALAEQYYVDTPSLRADEREEKANVWYLKDNALVAVAVPRQIYSSVMCMRVCEEVLSLKADSADAVALWLAANFRREAALGMNVQSVEADPKGLADQTRPANYPRSLYFARCFGPRHSLLALARGIRDNDSVVALGAVTAVEGIASGKMLVGPDETAQSLVSALSFPDVLVRITAALALAKASPPQDFRGSQLVIPILASAIDLRGTVNVLIVEPDEPARRLLEETAKRHGGTVIAAASLSEAANRARRDMAQVDLLLLSGQSQSPGAADAVRQLRDDDRLALAPVVLVVRPGGALVAEQVAAQDRRIERLILRKTEGLTDDETKALDEMFVKVWERARKNYGRQTLTPEHSLKLSLAAADALRMVAVSGTSVFQFAAAEAALVRACGHPDETMRLKAAAALAWAPSGTAQGAIAKLALDDAAPETQRVAAFDLLAESAKRFGKTMADDLVNRLTEQTLRGANLTIRTAASQALGAFNLAGGQAAEIIRSASVQ